jgi:hypothetical protein
MNLSLGKKKSEEGRIPSRPIFQQPVRGRIRESHIIIDVQKKVAKLLGHPITETEKS